MASLTRTIAVTALLCGIVLLGYWRLTFDQQARTIAELNGVNDQLRAGLAQRQAMIERLGRTRRLAHLQITDQKLSPSGAAETTTVRFIELDEQGTELAQQHFTVPGDVVFVDAWTVKFDSELVAQGDLLRGRTLVLLRKIYSDQLPPKDGLAIDTPGAVPPGYAAGEPGRYEKKLWENFWQIASDPEMSRAMGVRVAQGEAVYKPVRAGQTYELIVDAAGGMSLSPLPALTKVGD